MSILETEKRLPGRPSKDSHNVTKVYVLEIKATQNKEKINQAIIKSCIFVLVSNDLEISALDIL
ncbi:MAG: hypothetical protein RSD77_10460 [Romboutsia sp.]